MRTEIKMITPELATEMLKHNKSNRTLRKYKVLQYAHDMQNGKWNLTGQGITFGKDGSLLDGQHRLHAIKFSKVSIPMLVVYDADVVGTYDCGLTRSTVDQFKLANELNIGNLYTTNGMAILKLCYRIEQVGTLAHHAKIPVTTADLEEYINCNKDDLSWVVSLMEAGHSSISGTVRGLRRAIISASLYLIYKLNIGFSKSDAMRFARILRNGLSERPTDAPIIALRNKLISIPSAGVDATNNECFLRIQYAVSKYMEGSTSLRSYLPDKDIFDFTKLKGEKTNGTI